MLTTSSAADLRLPIPWLSVGGFRLDLPRDSAAGIASWLRCMSDPSQVLPFVGSQPWVARHHLLRPLSHREAPIRAAPFPSGMEGPGKTTQHLPAWTMPSAPEGDKPALLPRRLQAPRGLKSAPSRPVFCSGSFMQMKGEVSGSCVVRHSPFPAPGWADLDVPITPGASRLPAAPWLRLPHGPALAASSPQAGSCSGK